MNQHTFALCTKKPSSLLLGAALVVVAIGLAGVVDAQVKKGKTRPATTGQLMRAIMKSNCDGVKKGLDANPSDDKAWEQLGAHAAALNEVSFILMEDGRCPDGVWADAASKVLREGSADLLKAVEAKDAAAAKSAFGAMTKSCKACHDKHKEKK
jgi:cytochrome c556